MAHFSPAIPRYILKHLIEREAQKFRTYLGFSPDDPVDAFEIANLLGVEVVYPDTIRQLRPITRQLLLGTDRDNWSGVTYYIPGKGEYVLLNPTHSDRRTPATLMEELAHIHLAHVPSLLHRDPTTGLTTRTYDSDQEWEAYMFGIATLVPKRGLKDLYVNGFSIDDAARYYGVSPDLITLRTNLHGLRNYVKKDPAKANISGR